MPSRIGKISICLIVLSAFTSSFGQTDPFQPQMSRSAVSRLESARRLVAKGKTEQALSDLNQLVSDFPAYYRARYNQGLAITESGDYTKGAEVLKTAAEMRDREHIAEYSVDNSLGWALMLAGNYAAAEQSFLACVAHEHDNSRVTNTKVFNNLGLLYIYMDDFDRAEKYLKHASTVYDSPGARSNLQLLARLKAARANPVQQPTFAIQR